MNVLPFLLPRICLFFANAVIIYILRQPKNFLNRMIGHSFRKVFYFLYKDFFVYFYICLFILSQFKKSFHGRTILPAPGEDP